MVITEIILTLTLAGLVFNINDVAKVKKENEQLREEIETIKQHISKE